MKITATILAMAALCLTAYTKATPTPTATPAKAPPPPAAIRPTTTPATPAPADVIEKREQGVYALRDGSLHDANGTVVGHAGDPATVGKTYEIRESGGIGPANRVAGYYEVERGFIIIRTKTGQEAGRIDKLTPAP